MKKKVLSLLLCTAMAVSSLVGCGGTDAAPQTEPSKDAEVTTDATADATTEKIVLDIYAQYAHGKTVNSDHRLQFNPDYRKGRL